MLLEDLIAHHLDGLFPGMHVRDSYLFRVTRDADLDLQEDEADDLLRAIESELRRRRFGEPVRLEIERGMPEYMRDLLCDSLELEAVDCYEIDGMMALSDLWQIVNLPGYDHLRDKPFMPAIPKRLIGVTDIFAQIREGDILLHHPYESFDPVMQFVQQAAEDPKGARDQGDALSHLGKELADRARAARRPRRTKSKSPSSSSSKRGSTKRTTSSGRSGSSAPARTSSTASPTRRCTPRRCSSCARTKTASAATCTSARATTTRRPRASTPI